MAVTLKSYPLFVTKQWRNRNFIFSVLTKIQCALNGVLNSYEKNKIRLCIIVLIILIGAIYYIPFFKPLEINNILLGYEYTVYSDYVELIEYNGKKEIIKIPNYLYGRPVKVIGDGCFKENMYVEKVLISDTVEIIDQHSFINCKNLLNVEFCQSVKKVDYAAFRGCDFLEEVLLNDKLACK